MKPKKVCRCDAYKFPHREFGGACEGDMSECTCRARPASIVDESPPEVMTNPNCPIHGRDWDAVQDQQRDDRMTGNY